MCNGFEKNRRYILNRGSTSSISNASNMSLGYSMNRINRNKFYVFKPYTVTFNMMKN